MRDVIAARLRELGYEPSAADEKLVEHCSKKVENHIKSVTNLSFVPSGLDEIFIDRVCGEVLFSKLLTGEFGDEFLNVKSITEGDVSVSFLGQITSEQVIEKLKNSGEGEILCYRKIRW